MRFKVQWFSYVIAIILGGVLRMDINLSHKIVLSFLYFTVSVIFLYSEKFLPPPSKEEEESYE